MTLQDFHRCSCCFKSFGWLQKGKGGIYAGGIIGFFSDFYWFLERIPNSLEFNACIVSLGSTHNHFFFEVIAFLHHTSAVSCEHHFSISSMKTFENMRTLNPQTHFLFRFCTNLGSLTFTKKTNAFLSILFELQFVIFLILTCLNLPPFCFHITSCSKRAKEIRHSRCHLLYWKPTIYKNFWITVAGHHHLFQMEASLLELLRRKTWRSTNIYVRKCHTKKARNMPLIRFSNPIRPFFLQKFLGKYLQNNRINRVLTALCLLWWAAPLWNPAILAVQLPNEPAPRIFVNRSPNIWAPFYHEDVKP